MGVLMKIGGDPAVWQIIEIEGFASLFQPCCPGQLPGFKMAVPQIFLSLQGIFEK